MLPDVPYQAFVQSNLGFRRRCLLKNFKMATMWPSWISERNDCSHSESTCNKAFRGVASLNSKCALMEQAEWVQKGNI